MKKIDLIFTLLLFSLLILISCTSTSNTISKQSEPTSEIENTSTEAIKNNPIDEVLINMEQSLTDKDKKSETYAYLVARQWYSELKHIDETYYPNDNLYDINIYQIVNYIVDYSSLFINKTADDDFTYRQIELIGKLLKDEVYKFRELLITQGIDPIFLTNENDFENLLSTCNFELIPNPDWNESNPMQLYAEIPDRNIYIPSRTFWTNSFYIRNKHPYEMAMVDT